MRKLIYTGSTIAFKDLLQSMIAGEMKPACWGVFKGFDARQYNLRLTSGLIGTAGGKRRISSNFLLLLISPNRTHTPGPSAQSLLMAKSLIIISHSGGQEWKRVQCSAYKGKEAAPSPDYIAITLYRCRLMGSPNHAKRSMANMLEVCVQVLQLRWGAIRSEYSHNPCTRWSIRFK